MRKTKITVKFAAAVLIAGITAFLAVYVNRPLAHVSAAIAPEQTSCVDPTTGICDPNCSTSDKENCPPSQTTTSVTDSPPQVLGDSITAPMTAGK